MYSVSDSSHLLIVWVVGSEPVHAVAQQNGENRMKQFEGEQQFYIIVASTLI